MNCRRALLALLMLGAIAPPASSEDGLVGYWKLRGDSKDYSGHNRHGTNHGADLSNSHFNGSGAYVEVPHSSAFSAAEFSLAAWFHSDEPLNDVVGDLISKYDVQRRKGFNLTVSGSAPGYNSTSDARHVQFGIDDNSAGEWMDCGRPGGQSHNSDALTVFRGDLYVGTTDAPDVDGWAHVYRYGGEQQWEDCGRLGNGRTRGVYAMVVHNNELYAATSASHGPQPNTMHYGRVYRYRGGSEWEDIGQPGSNYRLNSLASYNGKLYVCGFNIGPEPGHCYVYEGGQQWKDCGEFAGWPHTMAVHDHKLYVAYPRGEVYAFDGAEWQSLGNPFQTLEECNQIHSLGVYRGELYAGTWPKGRIAVLRNGEWFDAGRPGDATEVIALTVYNGSLYAGSIPRAEVFRLESCGEWQSVKRLFDPPGFQPVPVGSSDAAGVADWSRATSLTVFQDKLFASTGTCYRTMMEMPRPEEIRGKVFAFQAGAHVSHDHDVGAGWRHVAAVRRHDQLELYIDGQKSATARVKDLQMDPANEEPLKIGFGQTDYFSGRIREVRFYDRALTAEDVQQLFQQSID